MKEQILDVAVQIVERLTRIAAGAAGATVAALLIISFAAPVKAADFTIAEALSLPMPLPRSFAASRDGDLAWVQWEQGRQNIYLASHPDHSPRRLTAFEADDGNDLSGLRFTADGRHILFVQGGPPNNRGEIYNALHLPDPTERALWSVTTAGGNIQKIAAGNSPAISPATPSPVDDRILFVKGREVWQASLGSDDPSARRLFTARGSLSELAWSPDGRRIAFVSDRSFYDRGNYGFVGVFDTRTGSLSYLAPSIEQVTSPAWSPDGRRLAFIRVPIEPRSYRFTSRREAIPWSIVVADAETGEGQVVWTADDGAGSGYSGLDESGDLFWMADDLIVFPWEKTGWKLLYAVRASGGEARLLTPGRHEVRSAAQSPDRRAISYATNLPDPERVHLWLWSGNAPRQLTSGDGVEDLPVFVGDSDTVAHLHSTATVPMQVYLVGKAGKSKLIGPAIDPTRSPVRYFAPPQSVSFKASDGEPVSGYFYPAKREGKGPVIVFAHGGSRRSWFPAFGLSAHYQMMQGFFQYLTRQGFSVLVVEYRSGTGRGLAFREAPGYGGGGATDVNDFIGAAQYLASRVDVDAKRIGIMGWSFGGHLVTNALARAPDLYAAGVSVAGVGDWVVEMEKDSGPLPFNLADRMKIEELAHQSSAIAHVDTWRSPILFINGDDDRDGVMQQTIELALALRKRRIPAETLIYPDESHNFQLHRNQVSLLEATFAFFNKWLAGKNKS